MGVMSFTVTSCSAGNQGYQWMDEASELACCEGWECTPVRWEACAAAWAGRQGVQQAARKANMGGCNMHSEIQSCCQCTNTIFSHWDQ